MRERGFSKSFPSIVKRKSFSRSNIYIWICQLQWKRSHLLGAKTAKNSPKRAQPRVTTCKCRSEDKRKLCGSSCGRISCILNKKLDRQECIPVGCVPPAALAIPGGLHQAPPRADTPWEQTIGTDPPNPDQAPGSRPHQSRPPGPGNSPCEQNSWHTLVKILPCPKLRLRAPIRWSS